MRVTMQWKRINASSSESCPNLPRPRFHGEPREFSHMHDLQPRLRYVVKVTLPLLARPLLRIIVSAYFHSKARCSSMPK
jgi:hypothetical protein